MDISPLDLGENARRDMVMTLEDEFGIEVPDDAIESLRAVGDVVNFVDSHAQN